MHPLDDLSIFDSETAQIFAWTPGGTLANGGTHPHREVITIPTQLLKDQALYCRYYCRSELSQSFFQRRRGQEFLSVEYIFEGEICLRSGRSALVAEPGDMILLQPGRDNDLFYRPGSICRKYGLIFGGRSLREILKMLRLDRLFHLSFADHSRPVEFLERFAELLPAYESPLQRDRLAGLTFEFFQFLANAAKVPATEELAGQIRKFLDDNYTTPISMSRVATEFQMSLPTLYKYFAAAFNKTPHEYLTELRLTKAAELLEKSNLRIKEIALGVGYNSPEHFTAEFRRFYGVSPRDFRRKVD